MKAQQENHGPCFTRSSSVAVVAISDDVVGAKSPPLSTFIAPYKNQVNHSSAKRLGQFKLKPTHLSAGLPPSPRRVMSGSAVLEAPSTPASLSPTRAALASASEKAAAKPGQVIVGPLRIQGTN